jgi:uncharacterized membrane protein
MGSTTKRSLTKAITYRLISSVGVFTVVSILTGSVAIGGIFTLGEACVKIAVFYLHERLWKKVKWGKI